MKTSSRCRRDCGAISGRGGGRRLKGSGGSAWESNPAPPRERGASDFEDREGHRAPFASLMIFPERIADRQVAGFVWTRADHRPGAFQPAQKH
jgi:hypothetical protein